LVERRKTVRCGSLIRDARRRHGLGQAELAKRLGTSQPAISRIERDQVSPTLNTLNRIFEAMGETLTISTLRLDEPPPSGSNQTIAELSASFEQTPEDRLAEAAQLSEIATELASRV